MKYLFNKFTDYFKEIIYGGIDGIVTTFAVVAGFSGSALPGDKMTDLSFMVVLLFGLANLFGDAASMGLGNFLSVRSEKSLYESYRQRELVRVQNNVPEEIQETKSILTEKGFSESEASALSNLYKSNKEYWLDFIMSHKLKMSDPRGENEFLTGFATFLSFVVFGAIPLLPFLFKVSNSSQAFLFSTLATGLALILLGLLKWRVIGGQLMSSLVEVLTVGSTAAVLAYFVGTFFDLNNSI